MLVRPWSGLRMEKFHMERFWCAGTGVSNTQAQASVSCAVLGSGALREEPCVLPAACGGSAPLSLQECKTNQWHGSAGGSGAKRTSISFSTLLVCGHLLSLCLWPLGVCSASEVAQRVVPGFTLVFLEV